MQTNLYFSAYIVVNKIKATHCGVYVITFWNENTNIVVHNMNIINRCEDNRINHKKYK